MLCPAAKNPPCFGRVCGPCTTRTGSGGTSSFQPRSLIQRSAWRTKRPPSFCQSWHPTNSGSRSSASRFSAALSRFHSRSAGMRLPRPVGYICQNCKKSGSICSVAGASAPSSPSGGLGGVSVLSLSCLVSVSVTSLSCLSVGYAWGTDRVSGVSTNSGYSMAMARRTSIGYEATMRAALMRTFSLLVWRR